MVLPRRREPPAHATVTLTKYKHLAARLPSVLSRARSPAHLDASGRIWAHLAEAGGRECGSFWKVSEVATKSADSAGATGAVTKALGELASPLVHADGGELYLVSATAEDVHLHLTGTCAGCPGAAMTRERLLEPVVRTALPRATVKLTTGWSVPEGAKRVGA
ncbi:MAG: hypothetical protein JWP97_3370 [Labilithrix sp.]|nr:hypothetical protein [Labilithrix sp.]